jgi:hypothetical protein
MTSPIKLREAQASGRRMEISVNLSQFKNQFMLSCFRWNRCFSTPDKIVRYAIRTKKVTLAPDTGPGYELQKKGGTCPPFQSFWAAISGF